MSRLLVLLFVTYVISLRVSAEDVAVLETVVVSASRPAADSVNTQFQTGNVSVIEVDETGKSLATVADLLDRETSVQVRQVAGLGSYSSISVRGSSSDQVNVYLDGILLNDVFGGSVDLSQFLLTNVETIEIYRGSVPAQLGASGIGGAINIKTKDAKGKPGGRFELGYGSFESKKAALTSHGKIAGQSYQASVSYLASDNDFEFLNDGQTPDNPTDDTLQRRQNAQFEQFSGMLSMSGNLDSGDQLKTVLIHERKHKHVPNVQNDLDNNATFDTEFSSLHFKLDQALNDMLSASYQLHGSYEGSVYRDPKGRIGIANNDDEHSDQLNLGLQADYAISVGQHMVNVHTEIVHQAYQAEDRSDGTEGDVERLRYRLAVQDEWLSSSGALLLVGRAAFDVSRDEDQLGRSPNVSREYFDFHLGAKYWLDSRWSLSTNLSRDIRLPKLYELFGDRGNSIGNEDLQEEYAVNFDAGFAYQSDSAYFSAQGFHRDLEDAIVMIYDARGIGQPQNIAQAKVRGIEVELGANHRSGLGVKANLTSQETENVSDSPTSNGKPLPGIYEQSIAATLSYQRRSYFGALEYSHNSGGYFDPDDVKPKPRLTLVNLLNEYTFGAHKVSFRVENLGDEPVQYFSRFAGPGRSYFLSYTRTL